MTFPVGYEFWISKPENVYRVLRHASGIEMAPRPELAGPDHYVVRTPTGHEMRVSDWFIDNEGTSVGEIR